MNIRWLIVTLFLVLLVLGGIAGWLWWKNQPEQLYSSAQQYYQDGKAAEDKGDQETARQKYEAAEVQLKNFLSKKGENNSAGLLLQYRVLDAHARILKQASAPEDQNRADEKSAEANRSIRRAADDPSNVEAQAIMLRSYLKEDLNKLPGAVPYAEAILRVKEPPPSLSPSWNSFQSGAHFVLAWIALRASTKDPDAALGHLEAIEKPQAGAAPRWRELALEAEARKLRLERARSGRAKPAEEKSLREKLNETIANGLKLVQEASEQIGPKKSGQPDLPDSPTSLRGLFDFLVQAIDFANDQQEVAERARLAVSVCRKMVDKPDAPALVLSEVTRFIALLPSVVDRLPPTRHPSPNDWAALSNEIKELSDDLVKKNAPVEPSTYLALAEQARKSNDLGKAEDLAAAGLETAKKRNLDATNTQVRDLIKLSAWIALRQNKPEKAEMHLAQLRQKGLQTDASILEGVAAVLDGRLEYGVDQLRRAQDSPEFNKSVVPKLALAHAYMGLGRYDAALPRLKEVEKHYKQYDQLTPEEKTFAYHLMRDRESVDLELFRCYLGLGNVKEAMRYKQLLQDKRSGPTASLLLFNHNMGVSVVNRGSKPELAGEAEAAARKELTAARKLHPYDARLVAAEVMMLASQPEPNLKQAENVLRAFAFERREKDLDALLLWGRWLLLRDRLDDLEKLVADLSRDFPKQERRVAVLKAELLLARGLAQSDEARTLVQLLGLERLQGDVLQTLSWVEMEREPEEGSPAEAISRHEYNGRWLYSQGLLAQSRRDFEQALRFYEKSIQFAQFAELSRRGLLTSIMGQSAKESPEAANKLAVTMLAAHPEEPALLLALAETDVSLDKIDGPEGMTTTLKKLEDTLVRLQPGNRALGVYFSAHLWDSAGRPDKALDEIARALKADPKHQPSLYLGGRIALVLEDWNTALKYADELERLRPDLVETRLWRAAVWQAQGKTNEARKIYEELVKKYPDQSVGYVGMVVILEKAKDFAGALDWARRWQERSPNDLDALRAQVRLLTLDNKAAQAETLAQTYLAEEMKQFQQRQDETNRAHPARNAADAKQREQAHGEAQANRELVITLHVAQGFLRGHAFDKAAAWAERALPLAEKTAQAGRVNRTIGARLLLADVHRENGQHENEPAARKSHFDKAVAIYDQVWKENLGNYLAGNNLAWLYLQRSEKVDIEAAYAILQQVRTNRYTAKPVSGDRLAIDLLENLSLVYQAAGMHEEARKLFEEAAKRYAEDPRIYLYLGRAYAGLNLSDRASENFTAAVRTAQEKLDTTVDAERKEQWKAVLAAAIAERDKLPKAGL